MNPAAHAHLHIQASTPFRRVLANQAIFRASGRPDLEKELLDKARVVMQATSQGDGSVKNLALTKQDNPALGDLSAQLAPDQIERFLQEVSESMVGLLLGQGDTTLAFRTMRRALLVLSDEEQVIESLAATSYVAWTDDFVPVSRARAKI